MRQAERKWRKRKAKEKLQESSKGKIITRWKPTFWTQDGPLLRVLDTNHHVSHVCIHTRMSIFYRQILNSPIRFFKSQNFSRYKNIDITTGKLQAKKKPLPSGTNYDTLMSIGSTFLKICVKLIATKKGKTTNILLLDPGWNCIRIRAGIRDNHPGSATMIFLIAAPIQLNTDICSHLHLYLYIRLLMITVTFILV
jgi:hypothetical protein